MFNIFESIIHIENFNLFVKHSKKGINKPTIENNNLPAKIILCGKIDTLYLFPDFEFETSQIYQEKAQVVIKTMRRLIREFPCNKESEVSYLAKNFGITNVSNNNELYSELLNMELNIHNQQDSTVFVLGLRSISAILRWNIQTVSIETIYDVITELKPIVINFKRKELFFN